MNLDHFKAYREAQAAGDDKAVRRWEGRLVRDNRLLAMDLCNKYRKGLTVKLALEDAEQAALIGLLKAIRKWDPDKGTLSNLAGWQILDELQGGSKKEDALEHTANDRRLRPAKRKMEAHLAQYGELGTAEEMGVKPHDVQTFQNGFRYVREVSIGRGAGRGLESDAAKKYGSPNSIVDALTDRTTPSPEAALIALEEAYEKVDEGPSQQPVPVWALSTRPAFVMHVSKLKLEDARILVDLAKTDDTAAHVARRHRKTKSYVLRLWRECEEFVRDYWHLSEEEP